MMFVGIATVLSSVVFTFLQDYTMIIVAVTFLVAGMISTIVSGRGGNVAKTFLNGVTSVMPATIMILMANSIKYTFDLKKNNCLLNRIIDKP